MGIEDAAATNGSAPAQASGPTPAIAIVRGEVTDVPSLHELYRHEMRCQIIHDSFAWRGFSHVYLVHCGGRLAGYGLVAHEHFPETVHEFYVIPAYRGWALPMFRALLAASGARRIRTQTNDPLLLAMLHDCARHIVTENILFADAFLSHLACPAGAILRRTPDEDDLAWQLEIAPDVQTREPAADTGAAFASDAARASSATLKPGTEPGMVVAATGGVLFHYNPPFGDIYMDVAEPYRRRGFGSYLVQELKRLCYESGHVPAARCNTSNLPSRRTLERAGLLPCGHTLSGDVVPEAPR